MSTSWYSLGGSICLKDFNFLEDKEAMMEGVTFSALSKLMMGGRLNSVSCNRIAVQILNRTPKIMVSGIGSLLFY